LVFMFKFEEKLKLFNEFTPTPIFWSKKPKPPPLAGVSFLHFS
jgi:hypothetical protein